ncbi:MAG: FHA domain-containing protein [Pseudomonadota bacterium]
MAQLREMNGVRAAVLQPEHLVGRSPQCTLQLVPGYVSAQHALIRWNGSSGGFWTAAAATAPT